jgi:hypothetical protein
LRRWRLVLSALTAFLVVLRPLRAHEPDGRVALRYEWTAPKAAGGSRPLRVALTAIVALRDVRVSAAVPKAALVNVRALRIDGEAPSSSTEGRWPDAGVALGDLAPGQTVVFDLDVIEPAEGGGILAVGLDGFAGERAVHEGVGIPVGTPGGTPTLRNGALEFPAEQLDRAP